MMKAARILIAVGIMLAALNATAFLMLERRSRALDRAELYLTRALNIANDGDIQNGEPPHGMLIMAFYTPDYNEGVIDLCGSVGKWNGQSLIHTYYEDGHAITYTVSNDMPDAWYPLPESMYAN